MFKKCVSLIVIAATLSTVGVAYGDMKTEKQAEEAQKVKAAILSLGTGPEARVKLKLRDKTKMEGYISSAGENSFEVTNPKTGVVTNVAYPQVGTAKGNNLSDGAKIAIAVGLSIALTILYYKFGRRRRRGIF